MWLRSLFLALALLGNEIAPAWNPPAATPTVPSSAEGEIPALVASQYTAWNARDLEGYLRPFWHSPNLVYGVEGAIWVGWDEVRSRIMRDYPNPETMGHPVLERLEVHPVTADTVTTVEWWTMVFPHARVHGSTIDTWRHFAEGWRIVQTSTSVNQDP